MRLLGQLLSIERKLQPENMRIFQITDLHIGEVDQRPFDVDVRENFLLMLDALQQHQHDLLVISGDLCYEDGEADIYRWIRGHLDNRKLNYRIIPGNHDNHCLMVDEFDLPPSYREHFFFSSNQEEPPVVFLNSGKGTLHPSQVPALKAYLEKTTAPVCLFMHHPPIPMGVPYMDDNHAIKEAGPLLNVLTQHAYPITIFTGHYHVEKSVRWKNLDIHVTPSCFFQIDWRREGFAVDHHRCAYRWIDWDGDQLQHGLIYIN